MTVTSKEAAWKEANKIFPTDYEQDYASSERAGYPIFRSTVEDHYYDYICDLGNRLEVNLDASKKPTVNIWIIIPEEKPADESTITVEMRTVKSNETKSYADYNTFIADWRFWMGSGTPCEDTEAKFEETIAAIKKLDNHGTAIEIVNSGLCIKFTYYKWQRYDRLMQIK